MTSPFSAARTELPSGASILMPVPREAAKSVMTRPDSGQRNLSLVTEGVAAGVGCCVDTAATCVGAGYGSGVALACGVAVGVACA